MNTINLAVEKNKQLILDTERYVWKNPETGYKEFKTSAYMAETFRKLGYELVMADGITGFYTVLDTDRPGPEIMILGELDSIICPEHPESDPETGAVHSCGHNAQCAALVGVAAALKEPGMLDGLCGRIRLCAVPAEELLEIGYRTELKNQGKIKYFGGKTEFLYRGYFDGVDLAFMVHTARHFHVRMGSVGCVAKQIIYKGVAAHAGESPWQGRNALYAATCGINAANALRETFKEADIIRFHPIITQGGSMVNAIPESVRIESYVRGSNFEAITEANRNINRALSGAALSLGANVEIIDFPGYAPLVDDMNVRQVAIDAAAQFVPHQEFSIYGHMGSGSTDMGDLSCVMPVAHSYCGGSDGKSHGNDYYIVDPIYACVDSAKWQLGMARLMLENDAQRAKKIIAEFKPQFATKEEYFAYLDSLCCSGDRIEYLDNGTAKIKI